MRERKYLSIWPAILVLVAILCTNAIATEKIIYVDDDAVGENNGSSWENAYIYLQDALFDANSAEKPVEIRIAQGVYTPDIGIGITPGDRDASFQLINDVTIKGGYAGIGEPDPDVRNAELYKTILNGDLADNDIRLDNPKDLRDEPSRTDNCSRVITATTSDPNTILDGVVVKGAYSLYGSGLLRRSGGLFIDEDASITVQNCTFTENSASGIYNEVLSSSTSTIINCVFSNNISYEGGGISGIGNIHIVRCTFEDNLAFSGGGMRHYGYRILLEGCTFARNVACCEAEAKYGGGLYVDYFSEDSKIVDCIFIENIAGQGGGAQIGYPGPMPVSKRSDSPILMSGCTFIRNNAIYGGAIRQDLSYLDIKNCVFLCNSTLVDRSVTGAGGAISTSNSKTNLDNCIFSGNYALEKGASLYAKGSRIMGPRGVWRPFEFALTLKNCTFRGNTSPIGQTLSCNSDKTEDLDSTVITNCILDNGSNEIHNPDGSGITISYTNLRGGADNIYDPCEALIWSDGNIDIDALFADPGYWADADDPNAVWIEGDYHSKSQAGRYDPNSGSWVIDDVTSLCIDAGDPNSPVGDEPEPNGGRINMGAYGGTAEASKSPAN